MLSKDYKNSAPPILREYLINLSVIKAKSEKTIEEYFIDIRTFFRFLKVHRDMVSTEVPFEDIPIDDVDIDLIRSVTLADAYEFMTYLKDERNNNSSTRLRKTSSLRGFFNYLTLKKHLLEENPLKELETPQQKKSKPKFLSLEQSIQLLDSVDGKYKERDYCIITLFLNCGLRLSELVGLNVSDISTENYIRVLGKGNKERIIYLNDACISAVNEYLKVRPTDGLADRNALFISAHKKRMSTSMVQKLVYKYLERIGLDSQGYSCHKLRHTAATLMYQHGNVDVLVLQDILGHTNLSTTQIYTHLNTDQKKSAAEANPLSKIKKK
ncbi:MAG: tyrosine recombinase XerC [Ruminococcus sp.]|nr:tyrosine recombinase XerC [Ruminococcus sp.]